MISATERATLRAVSRTMDAAIGDDPPRDWRESMCDALDAVDGLIKAPTKRLYMIDAKDDDSTYLVYASSAHSAWVYFASAQEITLVMAKRDYKLAVACIMGEAD